MNIVRSTVNIKRHFPRTNREINLDEYRCFVYRLNGVKNRHRQSGEERTEPRTRLSTSNFPD